MRYAIISDLHANAQGWERVSADADAAGADVFVCLGDVIGYGPKPLEVLDAMRQRTENFVLGNHDAAVAGVLDASIFNDQARAVVEWTRTRLDRESIDFLAEVPLAIEAGDILFVHAEVEEPGRFHYIEDLESARANLAASEHTMIFVGHTHHPTVFALTPAGETIQLADEDFQIAPGHRYLVNVGSAGEPRNPDDIRARYVIYDADAGTVYFRRLEFDVEAYRADLKASGLKIRPYFLQIVDHQTGAGAAHAMVREMRIPIQPVAARQRPKQIILSSGLKPLPKRPAPLHESARRARKAILLGMAALCVLSLIATIAWRFTGREPVVPPRIGEELAGLVKIRNGGFESPKIKKFSRTTPQDWDELKKGTVELYDHLLPAYSRFVAAEGKQVAVLHPLAALCQGLGQGSLLPGSTYPIRVLQYEPADIADKGGGLRVELWSGHPSKGGKLLAASDYAATGSGRLAERVAYLRTPPAATAGGEIFLCLRHIPDGVTKNTGPVSIDGVSFGEPEP